MSYSPLEHIAQMYGNVVRYDAKGNPSIFVKFPKTKSSDLDASLPDHVHPAFLINGEEQDTILLGKFKGVELESGGTLYALPNMPPCNSVTHDDALERMRALGNGASGMTIADHGLLILLANKNGWKPGGNNCSSIDESDSTLNGVWHPEWNYEAGDVTGYRGWLFECLITHKADDSLAPDASPLYWKRLRQVGGIIADPSECTGYWSAGKTTLTGSGPMNWYLGSDPGSVCDITGNCREHVYGVRLVDCEIQLLEGNNAADYNADLGESGAWRAILPSATDSSYTLVAPGTAGTIHYTQDADGSGIMLDTVAPEFDDKRRTADLAAMTANIERVPYVPSILCELGLFPTEDIVVKNKDASGFGMVSVVFSKGEQVASRGGSFSDGASAGIADLRFYLKSAGTSFGTRPRTRD